MGQGQGSFWLELSWPMETSLAASSFWERPFEVWSGKVSLMRQASLEMKGFHTSKNRDLDYIKNAAHSSLRQNATSIPFSLVFGPCKPVRRARRHVSRPGRL